jgi:hypothetical protein
MYFETDSAFLSSRRATKFTDKNEPDFLLAFKVKRNNLWSSLLFQFELFLKLN